MNISSVGSQAWMVNRYNIKTGGVDISKLKTLSDKDKCPQDAVKVTISKEAKEMYARLESSKCSK